MNAATSTLTVTRPDDYMWSELPENERFRGVTSVTSRIRNRQAYRRTMDLEHASLYGDRAMLGFGPTTYSQLDLQAPVLSMNVVRNMVGAATSMIAARDRPKPTYVTDGGNWDLRQRAKKRTKLVDGIFYKSGFHRKGPTVFRDAAVFGTGLMHGFIDPFTQRDVRFERVFPWEILVDDGEALYGEQSIRNLYRRRYIDRRILRKLYPDREEAIRGAGRGDVYDDDFGVDITCDQVMTTEAWCLPTSAENADGLHVFCTDKGDLFAEPWTLSSFPILAFRWEEALAGWFGEGLAQMLRGIQLEINDLLLDIADGHHLIKGYWLTDKSSKFNNAQIHNDLTRVMQWNGVGTRPEYITPQAISPDVYQHLWNLVQKAYEIAGISQLSATSQKPAGLNSGPSIRAYVDEQTKRFMHVSRSFEDLHVDGGKLAVSLAKQIAEKHDYKVRTSNRYFSETISYKEADLDDDSVDLKCFPTSMLPSTPSGKIQFAEEWTQAGLLTQEEALDIVDIPDTEKIVKRKNATRHIVEQTLERIADSRKFEPPEPLMDLDLALRISIEVYLEMRAENVPDDRLALVRRYVVQVRDQRRALQAANAPPAPAQAQPMQGAPGPEATPPAMAA